MITNYKKKSNKGKYTPVFFYVSETNFLLILCHNRLNKSLDEILTFRTFTFFCAKLASVQLFFTSKFSTFSYIKTSETFKACQEKHFSIWVQNSLLLQRISLVWFLCHFQNKIICMRNFQSFV